MADEKPPFDPSQEFSIPTENKPAFDPTKPFEPLAVDQSASHQAMNAVRVAGATVGTGIFDALGGLARAAEHEATDAGSVLNPMGYAASWAAKHNIFGVDPKQFYQDAADYWKTRSENLGKESAVDPALENTQPAQIAKFLANTGVIIGEGAIPQVGIPLMLTHNALQRYGETYNSTNDFDKAERAMRISVVGNGLFMGQGAGIATGLEKVLPEGAGAIAKWAARASAATGGNLATGQIIQAADAASQAPEGERMAAFTKSLHDVTGEGLTGAVGFGALTAIHARAADVAKLQEAGAPVTAAAVAEVAPPAPEPPQARLTSEIDHTGKESHQLDISTTATADQLRTLQTTVNESTHLPEEVKTQMQEQIAKELETRGEKPTEAPAESTYYRGGAPSAPPKTGTAQDVFDYETKELGNTITLEPGVDLTKVPASQTEWVSSTKEAAAEFGDVEERRGKIQILARDPDGGMLIRRGAPIEPIKPTEPITQHFDTREEAQTFIDQHRAGLLSHSLTEESGKPGVEVTYREKPVEPTAPTVEPAAPMVEPTAPAVEPTFKGTTTTEWDKIKAGEKVTSTVTTDPAYAKKFARQGLVIEFKPETELAQGTKDHLRTGEVDLADVQRVTDRKGNVIYEAPVEGEPAPPPTKEEVAKAAYVPPTPEATVFRVETGTKELQDRLTTTGQLPTWAETRKAVGNEAASAVFKQLKEQHAARPQETIEKPLTEKHAATGDELPMKLEDGKVQPVFTNDPIITAKQIDNGNTGDRTVGAGKKIYVPDEMVRDDQVNPTITVAKEKGEGARYYVLSAEHPEYGTISKPGQFTAAYNADPAVRDRQLAQTKGTWQLTQEKEERTKQLEKLPPFNGSLVAETEAMNKLIPELDSRLGNDSYQISKTVGDFDIERLRSALIEELRWRLRKHPQAPVELRSIYNSTINNFFRLAGREHTESFDAPAGEDYTVGQAIEAEMAKRGVPMDVLLHPSMMPEEGEATLNISARGEATSLIAEKNVEQLDKIGLMSHEIDIRDALTKVGSLTGIPEHQRLQARLLAPLLKSENIEVLLVTAPKSEMAAKHIATGADTSKIYINLGVRHEGGVIESLLHEVKHHLTVIKLDPAYKRTPVEQTAYDNLNLLFNRAVEEGYAYEHGGTRGTPEEVKAWQAEQSKPTEFRRYYGLTNLKEFVTESTGNPTFQKFLGDLAPHPDVRAPGWKFKSILESIRKFVNDLVYGEPVVKGSLLDQAANESLRLATTGAAKPEHVGALGPSEQLARAKKNEELGYRLRLKHGDGSETIFGKSGPILDFPNQIPGTKWYKENYGDKPPQELPRIAAPEENYDARGEAVPAVDRASLETEARRQGMDDDLINTSTSTELQQALYGATPKEPESLPNQMGWLGPDGKFHATPHQELAEIANANPKLKAALAKTKITQEDMTGIYKFMEKQGFVRVVDGTDGTIYFNGEPKAAQLRALLDAAKEGNVSLIHDLGKTSKVMWSPGETALAAGNQPNVSLTTTYSGGKPTYNINAQVGATKAQLQQLSQQIGASTTIAAPAKAQLQQQIATMMGPTVVYSTGKDRIKYGYDSANNISNEYARQKANSLALDFGSSKTPSPVQKLDQQAMNFVVEAGGDKADLNIALNRIANSKNPDAKEYLPVVQHAIDNFDRLEKLRPNVNALMKEQLNRERSIGISTGEMDNYITRVYERGDEPALLGSGQGSSRYWLKGRTFEKLYDAINEGLVPKTLDVVDLVRRRIELGERAVQMKALEDELRTIKTPDGKPIIGNAEEIKTLMGGKERVTPRDYVTVQTGAKPLVVHKDYAKLFQALYGDSSVPKFLKDVAAYSKVYTLLFDSYHVGRVMFKELAYSKGADRVGYGKGLSLLEYADVDLDRAVKAGDITQREADWTREQIKVPAGNQAMTRREAAQALMEHGLNVGKVLDNVFVEEVKKLPFIKAFNNWVFQKLSRGAMLQTSIANLERNLARFPERGLEDNLRQTAKEYNEVFGNLQNQGWATNKTMQDLSRVLLLSPNWAESQAKAEVRGYGQIAKGAWDTVTGMPRLGTVAQGQLTVIGGMLLANQLLNYAFTGHSTFENKGDHKLDAFIPGGTRGFWFNPFEIGAEYGFAAHRYVSQHMNPLDVATQVASNKLSTIGRGLKTGISGRDYAGRPVEGVDRLRSALADAIPLPIGGSTIVEKDPRSNFPLPGYRFTRQPGSLEKQMLQSAGLKVAPEMSPRAEVYALAHPYREDHSYRDPSEYGELRLALERNQEDAAKQEIKLLVQRGKTIEDIRRGVPVTPEHFAGNASKEHEFKKHLTPDQKDLYAQAQAEHKANGHKLRTLLPDVKKDMATELQANHLHQRGKDVETP